MGRFKSKLSTLRHTYRLCRLGGMPEPSWLDPYIRIEQLKAEGVKHGMKLFDVEKDTRRAEFPEDKLIQSFYDRYPNAKYIPVDLRSFDPPLAKKFAVRQLALMETGMSKQEAQAQVEGQMRESGELVFPPRPSIIELIQLEEEKVLMDELGKSRQQRLVQPDAEAV